MELPVGHGHAVLGAGGRQADQVLLAPLYAAGETPIEGIDWRLVATTSEASGAPAKIGAARATR